MLAADAAWPGCGRSACRSAAKTRSVPSWPSTLIAAATSAVRSSRRRSASASTSIPSIPSVPLMSARPSFSASSTGASPAAASASAAGRSAPSASRTSPSPISASAQCDSGARSPEQPSEPYSWTTGVMPASSSPAISRAVSSRIAGVAGRQGREPQQHQRAHHLALDLGARPGGVRAHQRRAAAGRAGRAGCGGWRGRRTRSRCRTPASAPSASASTTARDRSIAASASAVSATAAPWRATATTSANETGPVPTWTVPPTDGARVLVMPPSNDRADLGASPAARPHLGSETAESRCRPGCSRSYSGSGGRGRRMPTVG